MKNSEELHENENSQLRKILFKIWKVKFGNSLTVCARIDDHDTVNPNQSHYTCEYSDFHGGLPGGDFLSHKKKMRMVES